LQGFGETQHGAVDRGDFAVVQVARIISREALAQILRRSERLMGVVEVNEAEERLTPVNIVQWAGNVRGVGEKACSKRTPCSASRSSVGEAPRLEP
jgi:hypothetical protein